MKIFELNKNLKASNADIAELLKQEIKSRKIIVGRLEHSQE